MGYTILFKSFTGTDYRLLIDGGGTSLNGEDMTFITQENADADMFTPVRTQTGSFRFVGTDDHDNWLGMIPTNALSKRVVLYTGSVIKWQGFIQPRIFENEYPGIGTQEHDISVQCPLSVLDTVDVDTNNNNAVVTFGELIQSYIFQTLIDANISVSAYYFQGSAAVTRARLDLKVMWANFIDTDSTGTPKAKYTYKQVLEEVCKFFGYTCRMHGDKVYFTMPVDNNQGFTAYTTSTILSGNGTYSSRGTFGISDEMFCDTDNHEEVHPGIGKVTVKSDINVLDNLIEIPYDELYDRYNMGVPNNNIIIRALDQGDEKIYYLIKTPTPESGQTAASLTYENDSVAMTLYAAKQNGTELTYNKYCRFLVYDTSEVGDPGTQEIPESKKSYGWSKCVELFHGTQYEQQGGSDNTTMFTITSKQTFVILSGILYISWKMRNTDAGQYKIMYSESPATVTAQLKVGNLYWSGTWNRTYKRWDNGQWQTTAATFTMYLDADGPKTTRSSISDPQYDGCGIPVSNTMRGILEFKIIDVQNWKGGLLPFADDNNGFVPMHDFEIGFVRGVIEDTKHRGNEYVKTGGAFRDEYNVDLIFASDVPYGTGNYTRRMPAGLGYILNNNNEQPTQNILSMSGGYVVAEEELARVISVFGSKTHRVVQLDLRSSLLGNILPTMMSSTSGTLADITGMFPLAISHNWRDDITTLTLMSV